MADLALKYFDAGLNQAEFAELEALLDASPEEALRFSDRALLEYKAMGLPEPRWRRRAALGHFRWPLALLFSAGAAWAFWPCDPVERPDLSLAGGSFGIVRHAPEESERELTASPAPEAPRISRALESPPSPALPAARQGSRLGVVIKQGEAGHAVVSVKNSAGLELRRLFEGELKPGQWRFEWDGLLKGGAAAEAGNYSIVVSRNGESQVKQVTIRHGQ